MESRKFAALQKQGLTLISAALLVYSTDSWADNKVVVIPMVDTVVETVEVEVPVPVIKPSRVVKDSTGKIIGEYLYRNQYSSNDEWVVFNDKGYFFSVSSSTGKIGAENPNLFEGLAWTGVGCTGQAYAVANAHPKARVFLSGNGGGVATEKLYYTPLNGSFESGVWISSWSGGINRTCGNNTEQIKGYKAYANNPTITGVSLLSNSDHFATPLELVVE